MKPLQAILAALALLATLPADAQPVERITVGEAVTEALEKNYQVLRSREQLSRLRGQVTEVRSQRFPQVELQSSYLRRYDETILDRLDGFISPEPTNDYSVRASLDQLLFSWWRVVNSIDIAVASLSRGDREVASTEREVKLRVHEAFYSLLLANRLVEVASETLAQRERQLDVAQKRFEAGVVNEFEVIRARVDVANAQPRVVQTQNAVRQAQARLNNLLSRDQSAPIEPEGQLEYVPLETLSLEEVTARAIERRPELAALRVNQQIAEKDLAIARAGDKPEVTLQADYGYASEDFENLNANREVWAAGVFVRVPLFDGWRTRGQIAQASSQLRDSRIAIEQLRESISLEAKVSLDELTDSEQVIPATRLNITQAEKALELAETSYRYGVATFLDVTDAQLSLTVAQTDYASALHAYMRAKARVLSVMDEL
jgi:outer membrane protein TolC